MFLVHIQNFTQTLIKNIKLSINYLQHVRKTRFVNHETVSNILREFLIFIKNVSWSISWGEGHWPWPPTGTCCWSLKSGPCQKWIFGKKWTLSEGNIENFSHFHPEKLQKWPKNDQNLRNLLTSTLKIS